MNALSLPFLFSLLAVLLVFSACFSASETALMSINRYRLMHLASEGNKGAQLAQKLLEKPERLIGLILLGNNFVNIMASAVTTVAFIRIAGDSGVLIGTMFLTVVVLIFAEVAPKTLAAFKPERVALPAAFFLYPLLKVLYPVVRVINALASVVLRPFGVNSSAPSNNDLSQNELRTLLEQGGSLIPKSHRQMLLNVLTLEQATVEDIMVPRNEVRGIDLNCSLAEVIEQVQAYPYSRAIMYRDSLDNVVGILNLRKLINVDQETMTLEWLEKAMFKPYYIPQSTRLPQQMVEFQRLQRRIGLVVNEYGDIVGLVTLADILEEIVGEFTTEPAQHARRIDRQGDSSWTIDGRIAVHSLNRRLGWDLPTEEATTFSGLIVSALDELPDEGTEVSLFGFSIRIEQVRDNVIQLVKVTLPIPETDSETDG
ncbi:MAG: magnesium/cobalt efflux protein [Acinetobacter sp.]|nr:magnesium/cobalt efflux protein [Acinetobacter sp.]